MLPQGSRLIRDFITLQEESALLKKLQNESWYDALSRKVIHYGTQYRYFANEPTRDVAQIPEWIPPLIVGDKSMNNFFNQIIINAYLPGEGIGSHVDDVKQFGDTIATLSLGSTCVMDMTHKQNKTAIFLPRRSLLILEGEARYQWSHGIAKRKKDLVPGSQHKITRTKRVSITYRCDMHELTKSVKRQEKEKEDDCNTDDLPVLKRYRAVVEPSEDCAHFLHKSSSIATSSEQVSLVQKCDSPVSKCEELVL